MGIIFFAYADWLHFRCSRPSCLGCGAEAWLIHTGLSKQRLRSTSRLGRGSAWISCMAMTILCLDKLLYYWNISCQSPIYFPPYLRWFFFCFFFLMSCDQVRDFHTMVEGFWYAQGRLGLLEQVAGTRSHLAKSLLPSCVWKKGLRGGGCVWKKSLLVACKRLLGLSWTAWE